VLVGSAGDIAFCDGVDSAMALLDEDVYRTALASAVFGPGDSVSFTAPYRRPRKIWGIGLNYRDHASDLPESVPGEPASFMKGDHTIIGPGDAIVLPSRSERVTAKNCAPTRCPG
jgi:2-keto-4-pentenoate hydratase/2-oxohepta-3-ene-1,7-dioic acid hydratase in catechol pathway